MSEEKELSKLKNKSDILSKIKCYAEQDCKVTEEINQLVIQKQGLQETLVNLSKEIGLEINKNSRDTTDTSVKFLDGENEFSESKQSVNGVYIFLLKINIDDGEFFLIFKKIGIFLRKIRRFQK